MSRFLSASARDGSRRQEPPIIMVILKRVIVFSPHPLLGFRSTVMAVRLLLEIGIVKGLRRAGLLEEALEVIVNIPISPNGAIWGILLGGCRLHNHTILAGCSSIAIDGVVHEFEAGDEIHLQTEKIFEMWEKLLVKMKGKGYVPNTSVLQLFFLMWKIKRRRSHSFATVRS